MVDESKIFNKEDDLKFAVIGAGGGGQATAAHLALMGFEVNLYNRSRERIKHIQRKKGIEVTGIINAFGELNKVTTNIKEAIEDADIIIVVVPASGHEDVAKLCAPYLKDGQLVVLTPGRTFGALEFINVVRKNGSSADIIIAETQTIIYTSRCKEHTEVEILALKKRVPLATLPATQTNNVVEIMKDIYPQFVPATNVLKTSLDNIGAIFHPTPTLLNAGWIETPQTNFKYYYEAITPTVAKFLEIIDKERMDVAEALGIDALSAKDWLYEAYGVKGETLYEALQNNDKYHTIDAPMTLQHRYIFEDVPTGLVPLASLGDMLGVPTPNIKLIIQLASRLTGIDFWKNGRTVEKLGLKGLSVNDIKRLVDNGGL
jgi:opine dehydrogenase